MREILSDVLKQSAPFAVLKVLGTDTDTTFLASSECKTLIFKAALKAPLAEFKGEFGISNLSLLNGLLNFASYKTDAATFNVKRRMIGDKEIVEQLEFAASKGSKSQAVFRLTSPDLIPEITTLTGKPTWDVEFSPDRAKVAEFQQLSSLYNEVGKTFIPTTDGGDLVFQVGNQNSSTHSASMVFQESVTGDLTGDLNYPFAMFSQVMKLAGANPAQMSLKSRTGPMKISIETNFANYDYIIRASR
jgi:hypothetical protein